MPEDAPMNPYEAPRTRPVASSGESERSGPRSYARDPRLLVAWLKGLLWAYAANQVLSIGSNAMQLALLQGGPVSEQAGDINDMRQGAVGLLNLLIFIPTAVLFLKWVARSNRNARGFGAYLMFSPNFATGCYFIPILNLFRPYQAMKEIWKASRNPLAWSSQTEPPILGLWWALWLANAFCGQFVLQLSNHANTTEKIIDLTYWSLASDAITLLATFAAMAVVAGIDRMQREWVEGRGETPSKPQTADGHGPIFLSD